MEPKENRELNINEKKNNEIPCINEENQINQIQETIIDLPKLSNQSEIKNSDIILAILEICTFNKKYNYDCSNNTKAFWERVVTEDILKKIFKNFKSETLRKYWKIIRLAGNNTKFLETVKHNEKFINNPVFKLLPIINAISSFVQTDEKNFEEYFASLNSKDSKGFAHKEEKEEVNLIGNKRHQEKSISPPKIVSKNGNHFMEESNNEKKLKEEDNSKEEQLDDKINELMKKTKFSREVVANALYGTSNNIQNAYLYLQDNDKYEKFYFLETDDYIIKNLRNKGYYLDLINLKGEELVKEREKFLGIK